MSLQGETGAQSDVVYVYVYSGSDYVHIRRLRVSIETLVHAQLYVKFNTSAIGFRKSYINSVVRVRFTTVFTRRYGRARISVRLIERSTACGCDACGTTSTFFVP